VVTVTATIAPTRGGSPRWVTIRSCPPTCEALAGVRRGVRVARWRRAAPAGQRKAHRRVADEAQCSCRHQILRFDLEKWTTRSSRRGLASGGNVMRTASSWLRVCSMTARNGCPSVNTHARGVGSQAPRNTARCRRGPPCRLVTERGRRRRRPRSRVAITDDPRCIACRPHTST
jgi:hypothetical protein